MVSPSWNMATIMLLKVLFDDIPEVEKLASEKPPFLSLHAMTGTFFFSGLSTVSKKTEFKKTLKSMHACGREIRACRPGIPLHAGANPLAPTHRLGRTGACLLYMRASR